jgi:hypothetical protein
MIARPRPRPSLEPLPKVSPWSLIRYSSQSPRVLASRPMLPSPAASSEGDLYGCTGRSGPPWAKTPFMGELAPILVLSLTAMLNPTLLAAVTLMMLLPETKRLMLGYLLGSYLTSISVGLIVVFALHDTGSFSTARNTLTPVEDLVFGAIALIVGLVLRSDVGERRRRQQEKPQREAWPQRLLGRGSPRVAFAVGALLSFPGASYLVALNRIAHLDEGAGIAVALVVLFCLVQQLLLEAPLVGYAVSPERTQRAVDGFRRWLREKGRQTASAGAAAIGLLLLLRGLLELVL